MIVSEIFGHMSSIKAEYNALLPAGKTAAKDLAQRDIMVCTLAILNTDLASVRDQILASPSTPILDKVFSRLLRVASIPHSGPNAPDTSALFSPMLSMAIGKNKVALIEEPRDLPVQQSVTLTGMIMTTI
ncbi:putative plastid-lipid-associated protein 9, chloroplastic [Sesbania bispinosa]|nr:putative plastid-lipid-associated protein 9, chloroplastic [Sesbania bispinosa]